MHSATGIHPACRMAPICFVFRLRMLQVTLQIRLLLPQCPSPLSYATLLPCCGLVVNHRFAPIGVLPFTAMPLRSWLLLWLYSIVWMAVIGLRQRRTMDYSIPEAKAFSLSPLPFPRVSTP